MYTYLVTTARLALLELAHHRGRSFLTSLGILIGVACVVVIVSVGEGLNEYFETQIVTQATADLVFVMPDVPLRIGQQTFPVARSFRQRDLEAVGSSEYVQAVFGGAMDYAASVKHGWRSTNVLLIAAPAEFLPVNNNTIASGRNYTLAEERSASAVAVIGPEVITELYEPHETVLGSQLRIGNQRFKVIGVLESRSAMENGHEVNLGVYIPLATGQHRVWGTHDMSWLFAKVRSREDLESAKEDIAARLRQSRRIRSGADDDFSITTMQDWARFASGFVKALIVVFGVVAIIALIVEAIGVMNVMLVAVKERTREIGLRKALGATSGQVAWQFLIESQTLTLLGGLAGLGLGWLTSLGLLKASDEVWNVYWTPEVPGEWLLLLAVICLTVGLVSGVYPAWKASRLEPVQAMRQ